MRGREPAHGEGEWQGIADDELLSHGRRTSGVRERGDAVRRAGVDDTAVVLAQVVLGP